MNLITPEHISSYISFQYGDTGWHYDAFGKKDIPKLQAEVQLNSGTYFNKRM
jgi:hypothetical protein